MENLIHCLARGALALGVLVSVAHVDAALADPAHEQPLFLASGGGGAYWLMLAAVGGGAAAAETGAPASLRGYYLLPKQARISVQRDGSAQSIDVTLPSLAALSSLTATEGEASVPAGTEHLSAANLTERARLVVDEKLTSEFASLGAQDDSAEISFVDFSDWPRAQHLKTQKLSGFDPQGLVAAASSAFGWSKPLRIHLATKSVKLGDELLREIDRGFSVSIEQIAVRMRRKEISLPFPELPLLVSGAPGETIPFSTAFDRLNASVADAMRGQNGFDEMSSVLPQGYWRMNLLNQAYAAYYEAADAPQEPANACQSLRVRLKPSGAQGATYLQAYYLADLGSIQIQMSGGEQ